MAESVNDRRIFSLLEVTLSIRKTIAERYKSTFWVKAEMNKLNLYTHSGHCYPDLVEKNGEKVVAQIRANLWKTDYLRINENFLATLKEPLKDGITILFCAAITYDPVYGLSLNIVDIDPVFSLGELEKEKLETIDKLKKEGIFDANKRLRMPLLPQRIAIISVETSKGFSDFLKVIEQNHWGYKFFGFLFPALLQGDRSVGSILHQLNRIKKVKHHFDIVVIIRGGGGDVGLSSYNNYVLAKEVASFPIPVLTGIGHSTNETVVEMIAYRNAITPTELADFLLQEFHNFSVPLHDAEKLIVERAQRILDDEKSEFVNTIRYLRSVTTNRIMHHKNELRAVSNGVVRYPEFQLLREKEKITRLGAQLGKGFSSFATKEKLKVINIEKQIQILDPMNVVRRGFTMTLKNGKTVKSVNDVTTGDKLSIITSNGTINTTVDSIEKSDQA
jgi:exodeoxyribonuclease VII large subunit